MKFFRNLTFFIGLVFMSFSINFENPDSELLNKVITEIEERNTYDWKKYPLGLFSKEQFKKEANYAKKQLKQLNKINPKNLSETEFISLELLKFKLQDTIDYYDFERFLNPLLSDSGFHTSFPFIVRPFQNYNQVKRYLDQLNAIPDRVNQFLPLLREGLEKGVSQPRIIFNGYESSYNDHIVSNFKESYFYTPFNDLPRTLSLSQKDSILTAAEVAITKHVIPQFKVVKTFFEEEYYPKTRSAIGILETPNGKEYYQSRIDFYTTLKMTPQSIHEKGLEEVARINAKMIDIVKEVEYKGSLTEFIDFLRTDSQFYAKTSEQLLAHARNISKKLDEQLPRYFKTLPRKPYGVAPVPDAIAPKYTSGRYVGTSPTSTDPGYYWVNTYNLSSRPLYVFPSLTAHEAVPGHHLQGSLNSELPESIPQFRRDLYLSAYGEGWGLYSEYLADEMGIYSTPYEHFGKLTYEMWRASRLVVDTGIHAFGWTREEAVNFMSKNTALSIHEVNTEIDRYISWPGQAISYKIGELKIRELREKAEKELGNQFDIRDFHEVILEKGTVTLPILESRILGYIKSKQFN